MTEATNQARGGAFGIEHPIGVAVLGMGNVGTEVVRILREHADDLRSRVGAPVVLRASRCGASTSTAAFRPSC